MARKCKKGKVQYGKRKGKCAKKKRTLWKPVSKAGKQRTYCRLYNKGPDGKRIKGKGQCALTSRWVNKATSKQKYEIAKGAYSTALGITGNASSAVSSVVKTLSAPLVNLAASITGNNSSAASSIV
ncbi:MAG TPA: hypothetical protein VEP90_21335 [Methylomirabilota bacterium]|nr:hypothetical protein [Methylomirabilota bacterium]